MQELYAVRHVTTSNYLPVQFTRGGTWWEGEGGSHPRLFTTKLNAERFIIKWALGRASLTSHSGNSIWDESSYGLHYEPRGRSRSDLEAVPIILLFPEEHNV